MELSVTSDFNATPEAVWAAFESEAFEARLAEESGMNKTILEERVEGTVRHRRTQVERRKPLPGFAAKVLGSKTLTYIQIDRFDSQTNCSEWSVQIPALGDRVSVSGTTSISATPTGCHRVLKGDVSIRVRVVGKTVEKAVAGDFQKTAARAVELVRRLL